MIRTLAVVGLGFVVLSSGCTCWMEFHTTGKGGSGGMGGDGGTGGSGGMGGGGTGGITSTGGTSMLCTPGEVVECYSGPPGTKGKGECHAGTQTCADDGQSYGPCMGEQIPQPEECGSPKDEDCDGLAPPCTGLHLWSKRFGDGGSNLANGIALDGAGALILTGQFNNAIDFGGDVLLSAGLGDVFVAKFSAADGEHLWSNRFGNSKSQRGVGVAADGVGNVVVTGAFEGLTDFGGGVLTSKGGSDIFVAKFSANGEHLWSKSFGTVDNFEEGLGVAVDGGGNVLTTGWFAGSVDFGGGTLTSNGGRDVFVVKFNANGEHLWSKHFGDAQDYQAGTGVAVDTEGNVLVTGFFLGSLDFGGDSLKGAGSGDVFVAKLSGADGSHLWSKSFGDIGGQGSNGIAVDTSGDVLISGLFFGSMDFGGGTLTDKGGGDVFVAKLSGADGSHLWSKSFGDTAQQEATSIAADTWGNVIVSGSFAGSIDFGGGPLAPASDSGDAFLVKFAPDGTHLWSKRFGDGGLQRGTCVAADVTGSVFLGGYFAGNVDLGGGSLMCQSDTYDVFVAKMAP